MILADWGGPKTGKTTIALTMPEPIFIADFDLRLEGALHRFPNLQYETIRYPIPLQFSRHKKEGVRELWEKWLQDYLAVLENKKLYKDKIPFATISIDTATQMRQACNDMTLQVKQESDIAKNKSDIRERLIQIEYGEPNTVIKSIIHAGKQYDKHLFLTHYATEEYKDVMVTNRYGQMEKESIATGKIILDGFNRTEGLADIVIYTYRKEITIKEGGRDIKKKVFAGVVTKSGEHDGLTDMEFIDPSYQQIMDTLRMLKGE